MALFSRRKKDEVAPASEVPSEAPVDAAEGQAPSNEVPVVPETEAPASVGISMDSYRGLGAAAPATGVPTVTGERPAPARPTRPAAGDAPRSAETVPGVRDNVVLREALRAMPSPATSSDLLEVARQLLQGHLFLRVQGDARALLAEGKDLPLAVASMNGNQFVLAYSSGEALRTSIAADRETGTSAMGQPVLAVLRYVLAGTYAGLILDNASAPARAVLPRELLQKLVEQADESLELKTLLSGERTDATPTAVAQALTRVKFWVAVNTSAEGRIGVAEARTTDGARLIEVYSHPLEVATLRRGDQAAPMTAAQLAAALRADTELAGVIVDPGGPWIRLSRAELAPLLALG
jgi:hypothetical protein